jgi:hypothetical protein
MTMTERRGRRGRKGAGTEGGVFFLQLLLVLFCCCCRATAWGESPASPNVCNTTSQALRLVELRSLVTDPFDTLASWTSASASASFRGVTCDASGCVTALNLAAAGIGGDVEQVLKALATAVGPTLRSLSLSQNALTVGEGPACCYCYL